jgi:hypothetical protein
MSIAHIYLVDSLAKFLPICNSSVPSQIIFKMHNTNLTFYVCRITYKRHLKRNGVYNHKINKSTYSYYNEIANVIRFL